MTLSSAPDDQLYDLVTIDAGPVGMLASPDTSQAWRGTVRTSAWTGTRPLPAAAPALGPNLEHRPVAGADKAAGDRLGRRDPAEYVVGVDAPVYGTTQSPPPRLAPEGGAVLSLVRYGARSAAEDRPELDAHLGVLGVGAEDVVTSRFLARMVVAAALPRAAAGGLTGRPAVTDSGAAGVYLAGDWVGARGWLADASLASGQAAAVQALRRLGLATGGEVSGLAIA